MPTARVIVSADDFGLSESVNEAVERAYRDGMLSTASLMVGGDAAADAVRRAKANPGLRVGLHLVVIEGPAVLPPEKIPALLDHTRRFPSDQLKLGLRYAFSWRARRQLRREIAAQFAAFAATGLRLDHANAHKHMHLHPFVARMMIKIGKKYGLNSIRVPAEPIGVMRACGVRNGLGDWLLYRWTNGLRRRAKRAGMQVNDHVFGIAWSGDMNTARLHRLIPRLPPGLSEIYFHPASRRDPTLDALMPDYRHEQELEALLDPQLRHALKDAAELTCWNA